MRKIYLFNLSDLEEKYYTAKALEHYAIMPIDNKFEHMITVNVKDIDERFGRFRKLTPRECLRLMGFDDSFNIVCSDTETYKQAGNSIIVDVLMALLKKMDITKYGYNG